LLKKKKSGHWQIAEGRVRPGDLLFLLLPGLETPSRLRRELYAGLVSRIDPSPGNSGRHLVTVQKFYRLPNLVEGVSKFLEGKVPVQKALLPIWDRTEAADETPTKFDDEVRLALEESAATRRRKLKNDPKLPERISIITTVFRRNPRVVAEVLSRAGGKCEGCSKPAPFKRRAGGALGGLPYLEVHHIKQLADGGEDTDQNAKALCPNCHRQRHFG
jgi:5-methylcytosine-specific restriction endonuclease McrA